MSRSPLSASARPRPKTRLKQAFQKSLNALSGEEARHLAARYAQIEAVRDTTPLQGTSLPDQLGILVPSPAETMLLLIENTRRIVAERQVMRRQSLSTMEFARRFGRSKQWVHERFQAGKFLAFKDGDRLYFPEWQLDMTTSKGVVPGLLEVWEALILSDLAKLHWLTHSCRFLGGRSPLEALRAGEMDRVLYEAQAVGKMA